MKFLIIYIKKFKKGIFIKKEFNFVRGKIALYGITGGFKFNILYIFDMLSGV